MTTTSYCTRCGALVIRDELGTWVSLGWVPQGTSTLAAPHASDVCRETQEYHRPEADESYRGPRDFAAEVGAPSASRPRTVGARHEVIAGSVEWRDRHPELTVGQAVVGARAFYAHADTRGPLDGYAGGMP